jgi:hypothetical protein
MEQEIRSAYAFLRYADASASAKAIEQEVTFPFEHLLPSPSFFSPFTFIDYD